MQENSPWNTIFFKTVTIFCMFYAVFHFTGAARSQIASGQYNSLSVTVCKTSIQFSGKWDNEFNCDITTLI